MSETETIYDYTAVNNQGEEVSLADYSGKTLLIVNTASKCGFTPQYDGLQALQDEYADRGFSVLAFPCNQFGKQEPGSKEEIAEFCSINFNIQFPIFDKVDVNGKDAHPLFSFMKEQAPGVLGTKAIKWNFTKFLISPDGKVLQRYAPKAKPADIKGDIEAALPKS